MMSSTAKPLLGQRPSSVGPGLIGTLLPVAVHRLIDWPRSGAFDGRGGERCTGPCRRACGDPGCHEERPQLVSNVISVAERPTLRTFRRRDERSGKASIVESSRGLSADRKAG